MAKTPEDGAKQPPEKYGDHVLEVSGCGTKEFNGTYEPDGKFNGKTQYKKIGGDNIDIRLVGNHVGWAMCWNGIYDYTAAYSDEAVPPSGGWRCFNSDTLPVPTVACVLRRGSKGEQRAALSQANTNLKEADQEKSAAVDKSQKQDGTKQLPDGDSDHVLEVSGCGMTEFNGTYEPDGKLYGKTKYKKIGGDKQTIWLATDKWHLTCDMEIRPNGTVIDRPKYRVQSSADIPPSGGWKVHLNATSPAPTVTCVPRRDSTGKQLAALSQDLMQDGSAQSAKAGAEGGSDHVIQVSGCNEAEFNGTYEPDGVMLVSGKTKYRKIGGEAQTINFSDGNGAWYLTVNYHGMAYKSQSTDDTPPSGGWVTRDGDGNYTPAPNVTCVTLKRSSGKQESETDGKVQPANLSNTDAEEVTRALEIAMASAARGISWPHIRLMVRGSGGAGKSCTIRAMAGREFDVASKSTVGAESEDMELLPQLDEQSLKLSGFMLQPYECQPGSQQEAVEALAMIAAMEEDKRKDLQSKASLLDDLQSKASKLDDREGATGTRASRTTDDSNKPGPTASATAVETTTKEAAVAVEAKTKETGHSDPASVTARPLLQVPPELVLKYKEQAELQDRLVLHIQDTGGQPVFMPILDMLISEGGTVHMVVFSLPLLARSFKKCMEQIIFHMSSICAFAPGAPLILVGTRRAEVEEGKGELVKLSTDLLKHVERQCSPMLSGLIKNSAQELNFFAVENSKGIKADVALQELVTALDVAVHKLPSVRKRVPLEWLHVCNALRSAASDSAASDSETSSPQQIKKRFMTLAEVTKVCQANGLPHKGLKLEEEIRALLHFLHNLNLVIWYDAEPGLENLVILDAQWLIDATTCLIRDYRHPDHSSCNKNEKMKATDMAALRAHSREWQDLTGGKGILHPLLLDFLWRDEEFKGQRDELLLLLEHFGLVVSLPAREEYLVPALIWEESSNAADASKAEQWSQAGGRFRVHFNLTQQQQQQQPQDAAKPTKNRQLVWTEAHMQGGFLPIHAFYRLAAGILSSAWELTSLKRDCLETTIYKEQVQVLIVPEHHCIEVQLRGDGDAGMRSKIMDQFRVLFQQQLEAYKHLKQTILVPFEDGDVWADFDVLMESSNPTEQISVGGVKLSRAALKDQFRLWITTSCEFWFVDADWLRQDTIERVLTWQEIHNDERYSKYLHKRRLSLEEACSGEYVRDTLAVSHRWESKSSPDETGSQLKALVQHLKSKDGHHIKYVFYDYMSLPQLGPQGQQRTPQEKRMFQAMLPNINIVYLGSSVLLLADASYATRFWTLFEAWTSFQSTTKDGLSCNGDSGRATIHCMRNTTLELKEALRHEWKCSVHDAMVKLMDDGIRVTNESDKKIQLEKLGTFNDAVRKAMQNVSGSLSKDSHLAAKEVVGPPGAAIRSSGGKEAKMAALKDDIRALLEECEVDEDELDDILQKAMEWLEKEKIVSLNKLKKTGAKMVREFVDALGMACRADQEALTNELLAPVAGRQPPAPREEKDQ